MQRHLYNLSLPSLLPSYPESNTFILTRKTNIAPRSKCCFHLAHFNFNIIWQERKDNNSKRTSAPRSDRGAASLLSKRTGMRTNLHTDLHVHKHDPVLQPPANCGCETVPKQEISKQTRAKELRGSVTQTSYRGYHKMEI